MNSVLPPFPLPTPAATEPGPISGRLPTLPPTGSGGPLFDEKRPTLPELGTFEGNSDRESLLSRAWAIPEPVEEQPDFTDSDLTEALVPLVGQAAGNIQLSDDPAFESLLRATFRRALAEQSSGPFEDPSMSRRAMWRLQALFTSRTYEDVLADKIRRFQVEEVYLLDRDRLSLVSYASCDPVRHAHPRKVGSFARRLAMRIEIHEEGFRPGFELGQGRRTFIIKGRYTILVAVIRGELNDLLKTDLEFALRRIEIRYHEPFEKGNPLLHELQPLLEECLLIHSPAAPSGT